MQINLDTENNRAAAPILQTELVVYFAVFGKPLYGPTFVVVKVSVG